MYTHALGVKRPTGQSGGTVQRFGRSRAERQTDQIILPKSKSRSTIDRLPQAIKSSPVQFEAGHYSHVGLHAVAELSTSTCLTSGQAAKTQPARSEVEW